MHVDSQVEHVNYKPQIVMFDPHREDVKEADVEQSGDEDRCSGAFGGLLGGLFSSVEVDFSDLPLALTLTSVGGLLLPKTSPVLTRGVSPEQHVTKNDVEVDSLELQQGEMTTTDLPDTFVSPYRVGTTLPCDYFPQVAAVGNTKR